MRQKNELVQANWIFLPLVIFPSLSLFIKKCKGVCEEREKESGGGREVGNKEERKKKGKERRKKWRKERKEWIREERKNLPYDILLS